MTIEVRLRPGLIAQGFTLLAKHKDGKYPVEVPENSKVLTDDGPYYFSVKTPDGVVIYDPRLYTGSEEGKGGCRESYDGPYHVYRQIFNPGDQVCEEDSLFTIVAR